MIFDLSETPEEFWYNNLKKYKEREVDESFPQNLTVKSLLKIRKTEVAVLKGYLKTESDSDMLLIVYPTANTSIKNFIGIGISDREYDLDSNIQIYPIDNTETMTDDFVFDLLVNSHGWLIKDYGDLSSY